MAWSASPDPRFVGKWVVLEGRQVIASGANAKQTYKEAMRRGISSPFLIYVSGEEHEPLVATWLDLTPLEFEVRYPTKNRNRASCCRRDIALRPVFLLPAFPCRSDLH